MTKLFVIISLVLVFTAGVAFADVIPLKGNWTAPSTSQGGGALTDLRGFNIYRTDGTRTKINTTEIPLSACTPAANAGACQYLWDITVPVNSAGTATFVVRSVDTAGNEAVDSNVASYSWNVDTIPPAAIGNFGVTHQ